MNWTSFTDKRANVELRRIADSLEFIALWIARKEGIMYAPKANRRQKFNINKDDKAEVFHTSNEEIQMRLAQQEQDFLSSGLGKENE